MSLRFHPVRRSRRRSCSQARRSGCGRGRTALWTEISCYDHAKRDTLLAIALAPASVVSAPVWVSRWSPKVWRPGQHAFLRAAGVHALQGYLFGKATTAQEAVRARRLTA